MARGAFEAIAAGLEDAIAYAKGDITRGVAGRYPADDPDAKTAHPQGDLPQAKPITPLGASDSTVAAWKSAVVYWIYKDVTGHWRWRLSATDGKQIADSAESYSSKADCLAAIDLVKGSADVPVYERPAA